MMRRSLAHHPAWNMRQRSIELMDDEHVSTLETLTPNDNRRLPTPRVKRIMNPPAVALIPGSMSLLRPGSANQRSLATSPIRHSSTVTSCCSPAPVNCSASSPHSTAIPPCAAHDRATAFAALPDPFHHILQFGPSPPQTQALFSSFLGSFLLFDRAAGFLPPRPWISDAGAHRGCQGRPSLRHRGMLRRFQAVP